MGKGGYTYVPSEEWEVARLRMSAHLLLYGAEGSRPGTCHPSSSSSSSHPHTHTWPPFTLPRLISDTTTLKTRGVFEHDIVSSLPYVEVVSEETFEVTDVMMDECRVVLLKVSRTRGF